MAMNLWIPAREWKFAKKQKPQDGNEVLGIVSGVLHSKMYEIVVWSERDKKWFDAFDLLNEVYVLYWTELPRMPYVIKPTKPLNKIDNIHPAVLASILPEE